MSEVARAHLKFLRSGPPVYPRLPTASVEWLRGLREQVEACAFVVQGEKWITADDVQRLVAHIFTDERMFQTWSTRAIFVASARRDKSLTGTWYLLGSVLCVLTHPAEWIPACSTVLNAMPYGECAYVMTMSDPGDGCLGSDAFKEAMAALRRAMDSYSCRQCAATRTDMGLLVDAHGPVLTRVLSGLPFEHSIFMAVWAAQETMLRHAVFKVQMLTGTTSAALGFVPMSSMPGATPFGGSWLFSDTSARGANASFAGLEWVPALNRLAFLESPARHAHIVGAVVCRDPPCELLRACTKFVELHKVLQQCVLLGYDFVRGSAQTARRLVDALRDCTFVDKPGSSVLRAAVSRRVERIFHAWARDANHTTTMDATGGARVTSGAIVGANSSTNALPTGPAHQFRVALEWKNPPSHSNKPVFDLDLLTLYSTGEDRKCDGNSKCDGSPAVVVNYMTSRRSYCTHSDCQRYCDSTSVKTGCPRHGPDYMICHVEDQRHPLGKGMESMYFGSQVVGCIAFAVQNYDSLAHQGDYHSSSVAEFVTARLTIGVGAKSVSSSYFKVPRNARDGGKRTFATDIAERLSDELQRVALVHAGGSAGGGGAKGVVKNDALVDIVAIDLEQLQRDVQKGAGIRLPLGPEALDVNIRYLTEADAKREAMLVEVAFGTLRAVALPGRRLPQLVWHRACGFVGTGAAAGAGAAAGPTGLPAGMHLPRPLVDAMRAGVKVLMPVKGQGVFPTFPFCVSSTAATPAIALGPVDYGVFATLNAPAFNGRQQPSPQLGTGQYTMEAWGDLVRLEGGTDKLVATIECVAVVPGSNALFIGFAGTGRTAPHPSGYDLDHAPMQPLADRVRATVDIKQGAKALSHALQHQKVPLDTSDLCFGTIIYPGQEYTYSIHDTDDSRDEHTWTTSAIALPPWDKFCHPETGVADPRSVQHGRDYNEAQRLVCQAQMAVHGSVHASALHTFVRAVEDGLVVPSSLSTRSVIQFGYALTAYLLDDEEHAGTAVTEAGTAATEAGTAATEAGVAEDGVAEVGGGAKAIGKPAALKPHGMPQVVWERMRARHLAAQRDGEAARARLLQQQGATRANSESLARTRVAALERAHEEAMREQRAVLDSALARVREELATMGTFRTPGAVQLEEQLMCPITTELMTDPVLMNASGQTYERAAIDFWIAQDHTTDPVTRLPLGSAPYYTPNRIVRALCEQWRAAVHNASE